MTRAPTFEPVIVASWWRDRGGRAIRVRLLSYEGRACIDVGTWKTGRDGILRRTADGFTVDVKHIPEFCRAFAAAGRKLEELSIGVDLDEGTTL